MKRGLLLILIVVVAVLAWPAMTPGLFSGRDVGNAWSMAAEGVREIIYSPKTRWVRAKLQRLPQEVARSAPMRALRSPELPAYGRRQVGMVYAEYVRPLALRYIRGDWVTPFPELVWVLPPNVHHCHKGAKCPRFVTGVPEPQVWMLMIGGFGVAGLALRRRRAVLTAPRNP